MLQGDSVTLALAKDDRRGHVPRRNALRLGILGGIRKEKKKALWEWEVSKAEGTVDKSSPPKTHRLTPICCKDADSV